ncbi:MAG TPA: hypothetical protein VFO12_07590 [Sphingomicrobium sp.]|nr:hypothetical protein [Sphingomicrobium sp.]
MKTTIFGALALAFAAPALAQTPPAEPKMDCCEKMKDEKMECCCCKHMAEKGHGEHGEKHGGDKPSEHGAHQH